MKVYISGQITGLSHDEYTDLFERAEARLLDLEHEAVNPLKVLACAEEDCSPERETKPDGSYLHSWACYLKYDIKTMLDCDAILMLPNWHNSKGAALELHVATRCGLKTWYLSLDYKGITEVHLPLTGGNDNE